MQRSDSEVFRRVMEDLCTAFNRPITDDLVRVFFESLKYVSFHDVRRMAETYRKNGKKFPAPKDLTPERASAPPTAPVDDGPKMSPWAAAANTILLKVAYQDVRRGFRPMAEYDAAPKEGWPLPLKPVKARSDGLLKRVLEVKADYVRMAEEAEAAGDKWNHVEFNRMCREGFEQLLGTVAPVAPSLKQAEVGA